MNTQEHWQALYSEKSDRETSWYQQHASMSLHLIQASGIAKDAVIIDVGAGTSVLVDDLLRSGYSAITVCDISRAALDWVRARLKNTAPNVRYICGNILDVSLAENHYHLWHDRAVFHFLTTRAERENYIRRLNVSIKPGGHAVIATFAEDGPTRCSGLPVVRYSADELAETIGPHFSALACARQLHTTPSGKEQSFVYCLFRKKEESAA